jgi:hypothetical protein
MLSYCRQCGSADIRPSHLRAGDWSYFFFLRYPVRCRSCRERGSASLITILFVWLRARKRAKLAGRTHNWHSKNDPDRTRRAD